MTNILYTVAILDNLFKAACNSQCTHNCRPHQHTVAQIPSAYSMSINQNTITFGRLNYFQTSFATYCTVFLHSMLANNLQHTQVLPCLNCQSGAVNMAFVFHLVSEGLSCTWTCQFPRAPFSKTVAYTFLPSCSCTCCTN